MSQKKISAFFSKSQSSKRNQDEHDQENLQPSKKIKNSEPKNESECRNFVPNKRDIIKQLAKKNVALSPNIGLTWFEALEKEFSKEYFIKLGKFLEQERKMYTIFPPEKDVFSWTNAVKINSVKVVILGQDPYHTPGMAHGLAFSVPKGQSCPPSLQNIFKELKADVETFQIPSHGCLYGWAAQGVLLLNTSLTVRSGNAMSHENKGWETFTDSVIKWINDNLSNVVFMLWGGKAKAKMSLLKKEKHLILYACHPSPLSAHRGFFGCRHFSKANEYLQMHNIKPIDWGALP